MKTFYPKTREEWRQWLQVNHATEKEIWLVYYKKHTGVQSIEYLDSVKEALCFGWIDGLMRRIDDEKYARKFTIRKPKSKWSPLNISLAEKLIKEKKMTSFGLAFYEKKIEYDKELVKIQTSKEVTVPAEMEKALRKNKKAWDNFNNLAPSYKKQYIGWIATAKRQETRQKRLQEAIRLLEQNKKMGMK